jgi:broad specificity phosphatase PhoE
VTTRICLIRHGESEWNRTHRYTGQQDPPLSALGRSQAERVGERLESEPLVAIYSSPLARATQTAEPCARLKSLQIACEAAFAEIHHGSWEGLTTDEVSARYPAELTMWRDEPHRVVMPAGESLEDVRRRSVPTFQRIISRHAGEAIAIFSHDAVQRVLLLDSLGGALERFWEWRIENASVTVLEHHDGGFRLPVLNETEHLTGLRADYESQAL